MKLCPQNIDNGQIASNESESKLRRKFHANCTDFYVSCLIDMLSKICTSDWTNLLVENSSGKFGVLQVMKVLRCGPPTIEKAAKDFGKV